MSRSIDERVVQMEFDNAKFERNVGTTLGTLDRLKSSLDFGNVAKSFNGFEKVLNSVDLGGFAENVQKIADRFSILGTVGDQVIRRVTDGFINLTSVVKRSIDSLTLDQIGVGWENYANKTSAVQTIMAATAKDFTDTGEQMKFVTEQLEKLNWFTDETSYNFMDMVSNIGKFTSANVPLDEAVTTMQGIANWAAISGVNARDASGVMYQLSQAMGAGVIKAQDWSSVATRNMATYEFKSMALEIAAAEGQLIKVNDKLYETLEGNTVSAVDFQTALKDGWFTSKVFLKTLDKYGGFTNKLYEASNALGDQYNTVSELLDAVEDYNNGTLDLGEISENTGKSVEELTQIFDELSSSEYDLGKRSFRSAQEAKTFAEAIDSVKTAVSTGWMNSFELIFGNYQEAKRLWTDVANGLWDLFAEGGEQRNELLKQWHFTVSDEGNYYDSFVLSINNIIEGLYNVKTLIKEIFGSILPGIDLSTLLNATDAFKNISTKFKNFFDPEYLENYENVLENASSAFGSLSMSGAGGQILPGETLDSITKKVKSINDVKDSLSGIAHIINIVRKGFLTLKNSLSPLSKVFSAMATTVISITGSLGRLFGRIDDSTKITDGFADSISGVANALAKMISWAGDKVSSFIDTLHQIKEVDIVPKELKTVKDFYKGLTGDSRDVQEALTELDKAFANGDTKAKPIYTLLKLFTDLKASIKSIYNAIKEVLSNIDFGAFVDNLSDSFEGFTGILSIFKKIFDSIVAAIPTALSIIGKVITYISGATGEVGKLIKKFDEGFDPINAFTNLILGMAGAFEKVFQYIAPILEKIRSAFGKLFGLLLEGDFEAIKNIIDGLLSTQIMVLLAYTTDLLKDLVKSISDVVWSVEANFETGALLKTALAVLSLAAALKVLSTIDQEGLSSGIMGLSVLFGLLGSFMLTLKLIKSNNPFKNTDGMSSMLIKIAISMVVMAEALKMLAKIKMEDMKTALIGFGAILLEISGFMLIMQKVLSSNNGPLYSILGQNKKDNGLALFGKMMVSLSKAMVILAIALKVASSINSNDALVGVVALGAILAEVALFTKAVNNMGPTGNIFMTVRALSALAPAILILSASLALLALIKSDKLIMGILAIGSILLGIAEFVKVVGKNIKGTIAGTAVLIIAVPAILAFAAAIAMLGLLGGEKALTGVLTLGSGLALLAIGLKAMKGSLGGSIALLIASTAILAFSAAIVAMSFIPTEGIVKSLLALAGVFVIMWAAAKILAPFAKEIVIVSGALLIFSASIGVLGAALLLLGTGLTTFAVGITASTTAFISSIGIILLGIGELVVGIIGLIPQIVVAIVDAIVLCIPAIVSGIGQVIIEILIFINNNVDTIVGTILSILIKIIDLLSEYLPKLVDAAINLAVSFINGIAEGIRNHSDDIILAVRNLIGSLIELLITALQWLLREIPGVGDKLADKLEGVKDKIHDHFSTDDGRQIATEFSDGVVLGMEEKEPEMLQESENFSENFVAPLENLEPIVKAAGYDNIDAYLEAFNLGGKKAPGVVDGVVDSMKSEFDASSGKMASAGENLVAGLAKGILNRKWETDDAADSVANSVIRRTKSRMQIQSPSRVAMEIGKYWDEGQAIGMRKNIDVVEDAADEVANRPISSLKEALTRFSGIVSEDLDTAPVIRPVLDLSNVKAEAGKINKMFSNQNGSISLVDPHKIAITPGFRGSGPVTTSNYGGFNISVNANTNDPQKLAREIMEEIQIEIERKEAALA